MSRDKILGLALGILVLGFTGAFCFRLERGSNGSIPELNDPARLDRQIAEKSLMPYLTGVEGVEGAEMWPNAKVELGPAQLEPIQEVPRWQKPDFLKENQAWQAVAPISQSPPDPIPALSQMAPPDVFEHNAAWQPQARRIAQQSTEARLASTGERMHNVQRGETLSELASRYLGSGARYMELYEANTDVLDSPHNLRPGMVIRIPDMNRSSSTPAGGSGPMLTQPISTGGGAMQNSASRPAVELLPSPPQRPAEERFKPMRQSPLKHRGPIETSQGAPGEQQAQRGSQLPSTGIAELDSILSIFNEAMHKQAAEAAQRSAAKPVEASRTR